MYLRAKELSDCLRVLDQGLRQVSRPKLFRILTAREGRIVYARQGFKQSSEMKHKLRRRPGETIRKKAHRNLAIPECRSLNGLSIGQILFGSQRRPSHGAMGRPFRHQRLIIPEARSSHRTTSTPSPPLTRENLDQWERHETCYSRYSGSPAFELIRCI
jgi:hypothetical protein